MSVTVLAATQVPPSVPPLLLPLLEPLLEPLLLLLQPVKVERPKATERVTMEAGMKRLRMVGADDVPQEYGRVQSKC
jgi:hypothetical protein